MTNLETNGVDLLRGERIIPLRSDARLQWPDSLSVQHGTVYVTASRVHLMPLFNGGLDKRQRPYALYKVKLPTG